jgi:hypothetical protein
MWEQDADLSVHDDRRNPARVSSHHRETVRGRVHQGYSGARGRGRIEEHVGAKVLLGQRLPALVRIGVQVAAHPDVGAPGEVDGDIADYGQVGTAPPRNQFVEDSHGSRATLPLPVSYANVM